MRDLDLDILCNAISKWPALERLYVHDEFPHFDPSPLVSLKELRFSFNYPTTHFDKLAKSLVKLERVTFKRGSINHVLPFIRHCERLKTIRIQYYWPDDLNLIALNEERKKFGENAPPVWIYAEDKIYLREKWNSKNIELRHIKIVRLGEDFESFN